MRLLVNRVHRMGNLIDGILEYSRVGRVKEDLVGVNVGEVVREVIDLIAPPANITINIETPSANTRGRANTYPADISKPAFQCD